MGQERVKDYMKVLGIESSAVTASVAIVTEQVLVAEYTINYKKTHSQTLLPMIDEICKITETDINTVDLIAVSVGPGSFTGLRIGAATGKGIALATGSRMTAVPTLQAMAYNFYGTKSVICPIMDAKRRHVYAGVYRFDDNGKMEILHNQDLLSYEDLCELLSNKGYEDIIFTGDGIDVAADTIEEKLSGKYSFAPVHMRTQRAASVAMAGLQMHSEGRDMDAALLKPDYLRPSQAERERMNKND